MIPQSLVAYHRDYPNDAPGLWKWEHYLPAYERHLAKFVGQPVIVLEVGVLGGGSLEMWRWYFGDRCHVYGIDNNPDCRQHANEHTTILIGDQASGEIWDRVRATVPRVDIFVDDGSHVPQHQITTCDQMLSHVNPGGIYICEDIHGHDNAMAQHLASMVNELNMFDQQAGELSVIPHQAQRRINSIHFYSFLAVIELNDYEPDRLRAPQRGTKQ